MGGLGWGRGVLSLKNRNIRLCPLYRTVAQRQFADLQGFFALRPVTRRQFGIQRHPNVGDVVGMETFPLASLVLQKAVEVSIYARILIFAQVDGHWHNPEFYARL